MDGERVTQRQASQKLVVSFCSSGTKVNEMEVFVAILSNVQVFPYFVSLLKSKDLFKLISA